MKRVQMGRLIGLVNEEEQKKKTVAFVKMRAGGRRITAQFSKRDLPLLNQLLFKLFAIL
jgi:hypothetical protein